MTRRRLDDELVARGLYPSRARASDAIRRGAVHVSGKVATKAGQPVARDAAIALDDAAQAYVSRAALKLIHALDHFGISPQGRNCLDIGASTGGFTQVLLERGAAHVTAIDVGHDQMAPSLRGDPRVTLIERLNARELTAANLQDLPDLIVADVSFISLKLALPLALALAAAGARLVALIKPQFEAGRDRIGKRGVVTSDAIHATICADIAEWIKSREWRVIGVTASPVEGGDGNREFLIAAEKPC
ncbi:MAG: TlyA family RNA methyltransferase [Rhizobiales bacterium]|nr:TlyA family RNA methyltransferase [Hyphomicrobiales bacterium]